MSLRAAGIRLVILAAIAGLLGVGWWAQSYVRPDAVRAAVIETFQDQFPEARVDVAEAHMRVFGGISVRDLSFTKESDSQPFFAAHRAVIYHDKEQIGNGRLVIRKIELDRPTLRFERQPDGRWTFDGLSKPSPADRAMPTFSVSNGTVHIVDKTADGMPPLVLTDATFTLINDPPPLYVNFKGTGSVGVAGLMNPVKIDVAGQLHRLTGQMTMRFSVPDVAIGPHLAGLVKLWNPESAKWLEHIGGTVGLKADLSYKPDATPKLSINADLKIKDGHIRDPRLPVPAEAITGTVHYRDGQWSVEKATAKLGECTAEIRMTSRMPTLAAEPVKPDVNSGTVPGILASAKPASASPLDALAEIEAGCDHIDVLLKDLLVDDALFEQAGPGLSTIRQRFHPAGVVAARYLFTRPNPVSWQREFELRPTRFGLMYDKFRYPLTDVLGTIRKTLRADGTDRTTIDLTGSASGQRVEVTGTVTGNGPDPGIDVRVVGLNVPIDDRLFEALPKPRNQQALKKLHAVGRADVHAEVKQAEGENLAVSQFRVTVHEGSLNYDHFRYPLSDVSGVITIAMTDRDETRPRRPGLPLMFEPDTDTIDISDFRGKHGPGTVTLRGVHRALPNSPDRQLSLHAEGQNCPVDEHMKAALESLKLDSVWRTFSPRGSMTFAVDVTIADRVAAVPVPRLPPYDPLTTPALQGLLAKRAKSGEPVDVPFNPATDLVLMLNFTGPSITPDFFPYDFDRVAGHVRYDGTQVRVEKFTAEHGLSKWALDAGEIRVFPDGRIRANLGKLDVAPLVADQAFVAALPPTIRKAITDLNLSGGLEATMRHIVVLTPPDTPQPLPRTIARGQSPSADGPTAAVEASPDPEIYWSGEIRLADAKLNAGVEWSRLRGKIGSTGRYHGTHLGDVVGNIWLEDAAVADHPIRHLKLQYRTDPQTPDPQRPGEYEPVAVRFANVTGSLFGGTIGGEARVALADPVRYRLRLDATDIRLEDLARHHRLDANGTFEGTAQASLRLETILDRTTGQVTLDGAGTIDVDRGKMLNLPFLLPLLKTLKKLQAPDKTAFEEGHAVFTIQGDRIIVSQLDLLGDAISLGGSGVTDLRGQQVKFEFHTIWSQVLKRWLTTPFGDLNGFVSEKLFRIDVGRDAEGKLNYEARVVPFVTDPFRSIAERAKARKARLEATTAPGSR
jgi:hypothetical protein